MKLKAKSLGAIILDKVKWLLIAFGLLIVSQIGLSLMLFFGRANQKNASPISLLEASLSAVTGIIGVAIFIWFAYKRGYFSRFKDSFRPINLAYIGIGYLSFLILATVVALLSGGIKSGNQAMVETLFNLIPMPLFGFFVVISAPICEEILFRGLVFQELCRKNVYLAYLVSSLSFAWAHSAENLYTMLLYGGMGLILAFVYQHSKRLEVAIALHLLNNLISFLLLSLL